MPDDLREGNKELHDKINQIAEMVREMHQRQNERTIPAVEKIEKVVWGNGKPGLCDIVTKLDTKINTVGWVSGLVLTMFGLFLAVIEFIFRRQ